MDVDRSPCDVHDDGADGHESAVDGIRTVKSMEYAVQQICTRLKSIELILGKYINGSLKTINLNEIESHINMYNIQLNNLLSKQNENNTFIC